MCCRDGEGLSDLSDAVSLLQARPFVVHLKALNEQYYRIG